MSTEKRKLRVGDTVLWSGAWATQKPQRAVIKGIELGCEGDKFGRQVSEATWEEVHQRGNCVVDLSNGHWAYGYQINPMEAA